MNQCLGELLKNGKIDPLRFGSSVSSTVAVAGAPDGQYKYEKHEVLKYGNLQLFFESGLLANVVLDITEPIVIRLTDTILEVSPKTSIEQFVEACEVLEIPWPINRSLTFDRQLCLSTNAATDVFFNLDYRKLSMIQVRRQAKQ